MPSVATQPPLQLRAYVDALHALGYDVASLLAETGIRRADLDHPDRLVPCTAVDHVVLAALQQRRVPNLGARLAAATPMGTYPLLDYLVLTTDTVGDALVQLARYFHVVEAPIDVTVLEEGDSARVLVEIRMNPALLDFTAQYTCAMLVLKLRAECTSPLAPSFVSLVHAPDDRRDLERRLGCAVRAPAAWDGVVYARDSLRLALRRRDPVLRGVLEGHVRQIAPATSLDQAAESMTRSVRAVLTSRLGNGDADIGQVARQLATSRRTLQRRLAAEGVSFHQLHDDLRREAAERLLADRALAANEIGYLLGFSEPSAFHRACKRWFGVTPLEFRRELVREWGSAGVREALG